MERQSRKESPYLKRLCPSSTWFTDRGAAQGTQEFGLTSRTLSVVAFYKGQVVCLVAGDCGDAWMIVAIFDTLKSKAAESA